MAPGLTSRQGPSCQQTPPGPCTPVPLSRCETHPAKHRPCPERGAPSSRATPMRGMRVGRARVEPPRALAEPSSTGPRRLEGVGPDPHCPPPGCRVLRNRPAADPSPHRRPHFPPPTRRPGKQSARGFPAQRSALAPPAARVHTGVACRLLAPLGRPGTAAHPGQPRPRSLSHSPPSPHLTPWTPPTLTSCEERPPSRKGTCARQAGRPAMAPARRALDLVATLTPLFPPSPVSPRPQ